MAVIAPEWFRVTWTAFAGIAAVLAGLSGPAAAQSLNNGSFSTAPPGGAPESFSGGTSFSNTADVPSWTVQNASGNNGGVFGCVASASAFCFGGYTSVGASPDGGNYLGLETANGTQSTSAEIYQTITGLTNGTKYAVTFYQAVVTDNSSTAADNWLVYLSSAGAAGGTAVASTVMNTNCGTTSVGWAAQTAIFTATAGSETLTFLAQDTTTPLGGPPIALLDGIKIAQVPEPASVALLCLGFGGVAAMRRRRARAQA